jgi:hypothetical protein
VPNANVPFIPTTNTKSLNNTPQTKVTIANGDIVTSIGKTKMPLCNALEKMGWKQQKSPIQIDNSTAEGFANNTIIVKRMRAIEMRFNWLKYREAQDQFRFFWDKGTCNNGDYHTKLHPPEYHLSHRPSHAG